MRRVGDFVIYEIWGAIAASMGTIYAGKTFYKFELIPKKQFL